MRAESSRDPHDRGLSDLIGELSTHSDECRIRWAAHNVRILTTGVKLIHHPAVGELELPLDPSRWPPIPAKASLRICHIDFRTGKACIFKPRPIPLRASVARVSIAIRRRKAGQASRV